LILSHAAANIAKKTELHALAHDNFPYAENSLMAAKGLPCESLCSAGAPE